jgi:tetratricopeptide (TPR) repeat protein
MKKIIFLVLIALGTTISSAQPSVVDSLNRLLAKATVDSVKADLLCSLCFYEQNFQRGVELGQRGLEIAQKIKYKQGIGDCLFNIANHYLTAGNNTMSLHYYLEAMKVYEEISDKPGFSACYIAIGSIFKEQGDYKNSLVYLRKADQNKPGNVGPDSLAFGTALLYASFGEVFLLMHQQDSALKYFQRSYENFKTAERTFEGYQMNLALNGLGAVQLDMGHAELAIGYFREALRNGIANMDSTGLADTYLEIAKLYETTGQRDSSIIYGEKAMVTAQRMNVLKNIIESGKLLSRLYRDKNDKAALRNLMISQQANDSMFNTEKMMQLQNMFAGEMEREKEMEEKAAEEAEKRKLYLEYSMMAIGIVTFSILFLLLSRTVIVTEKTISFLGVLGLLVVFEFINLLIHPAISRITHESPVLLLLAYVIVASLLIPIHHRMEKWILVRVTEKNRKIRLANAKKTIEELESKVMKSKDKNQIPEK